MTNEQTDTVQPSEVEAARRPPLGFILETARLEDFERASLWDAFHSLTAPKFAEHLRGLGIPDHLKQRLLAEKAGNPVVAEWTPKQSAPSALDKTIGAISRMAAIDSQTLDIIERHPKIASAFVEAAASKRERKLIPAPNVLVAKLKH